MNNRLKALVLLTMVFFGTTSLWASSNQNTKDERNYFQFVIPKYETQRQGGQKVTIYVRFAYNKELPSSKYVDYRVMREEVLKYMEPSEEFPSEVFWEVLATQIGRELIKNHPIEGVSVQLEVLDNQNPNAYEPGDHGPVFTSGNIEPLDVHH